MKNIQYKNQITSTQNLIDYLYLEQTKSNQERQDRGLHPIKTFFLGKFVLYLKRDWNQNCAESQVIEKSSKVIEKSKS